MPDRCVITLTIVNRLGLHARPAMTFVDVARAFQAKVSVARADQPDQPVDGKSIMEMMMLAATKGTPLSVTAEGPDAQACCEALRKLVEAGFDEE